MAVLGRILQIIGWLWVIAGFFGPMVGISVGNVFPGFIILFVARIIRTQAKRKERIEEQEEVMSGSTTQPGQRVTRSTPTPSTSRPKPAPVRSEQTYEPIAEPTSPTDPSTTEDDRQETLERILLADQDLEEGSDSDRQMPAEVGDGSPMTSAEMIAQARKRWDRKPE